MRVARLGSRFGPPGQSWAPMASTKSPARCRHLLERLKVLPLALERRELSFTLHELLHLRLAGRPTVVVKVIAHHRGPEIHPPAAQRISERDALRALAHQLSAGLTTPTPWLSHLRVPLSASPVPKFCAFALNFNRVDLEVDLVRFEYDLTGNRNCKASGICCCRFKVGGWKRPGCC